MRFHICVLLSLLLLGAAGCRTQKHKPVTTDRPQPVVAQQSRPQGVEEITRVVPAPEPIQPKPVVRPTESKLRLPAIFSDNMVLQQGDKTPIWGWANEGEAVTIRYAGQTVTAMPTSGRWMIHLRNLKVGEPGSLTVSGVTNITFTNVAVGEVWVCSGQSNMEWPMQKTFEPEQAIATSSNSFIRLFKVPHQKSNEPLDDIVAENRATWQEVNPENVRTFSAVGYYFGRELHARLGVPIGLIQTTWGGSPAQVWMKNEVLAANPLYRSAVLGDYKKQMEAYDAAMREFQQQQELAKQTGNNRKLTAPRLPWKPTELYNGMVAPIIPYGIKGVIWYQGESNARAGQTVLYRSLFPDLIRNWREDWKQGNFPFLFVQLAPFKAIQHSPTESDWAELREAQLNTLLQQRNTGMAVITDLGDEKDIHPTKKAPVGERLALWARAIAYDQDILPSGPIYKDAVINDGKVLISFDYVGSGLVAKGGALKGFSIAGPDRKFIWARAEILPNNRVMVWSPNVNDPVAVRYGWADYPVINLWNREGLPASPFRTDDFPILPSAP